MNQAGIDRFCDFLAIERRPAELDAPRAVGPDILLPRRDEVRLRERLNSQYEAVKQEFGYIPDTWVAA